MERHMQTNLLSENVMGAYVEGLSEFLFERNGQTTKLRDMDWAKDFKPKSLIGIISRKRPTLEGIGTEKESRSAICEIIFEFKLLTLRTKFQSKYSSLLFEQYFVELSTVIQTTKSIKAEGGSNLRQIFHDYVP
jgi:hypothetical protein